MKPSDDDDDDLYDRGRGYRPTTSAVPLKSPTGEVPSHLRFILQQQSPFSKSLESEKGSVKTKDEDRDEGLVYGARGGNHHDEENNLYGIERVPTPHSAARDGQPGQRRYILQQQSPFRKLLELKKESVEAKDDERGEGILEASRGGNNHQTGNSTRYYQHPNQCFQAPSLFLLLLILL